MVNRPARDVGGVPFHADDPWRPRRLAQCLAFAGGHAYGKDHAEQAHLMALGYAFLRNAIGWDA